MKLNNEERKITIEEVEEKVFISKSGEVFEYEVIESINNLSTDVFCVLNNIKVDLNFSEKFENRFLSRESHLDEVSGFVALRALRPLNSSHYCIMTLWQDESSFLKWQESKQYAQTHKKRDTKEGLSQPVVNREETFNERFKV